MKYLIQAFSILFLSCTLPLKAQLTIVAGDSAGCAGREIHFSILPAGAHDTITSAVWSTGAGDETVKGLNPSFVYDMPGTYEVSLLINGHYTLNTANPVVIHPAPDTDFTYSAISGEEPNIIGFRAPSQDVGVESYRWDFGDGTVSDLPVVEYDFNTEGSYRVSLRIQSASGCQNETVKIVDVGNILVVPNIFTPNGDGVNDYFVVRTDGNNSFSFSVFSRAGVLLYHTETPTILWDGRTQSGIKVHPGVYYYVIKQIGGNPPKEAKGFVHLFR